MNIEQAPIPEPCGGGWQLNPAVDFLNHGSFGAAPIVVLQAQRRLQDALERDPIRFLAPERELEPKLDAVRGAVARLVGADSQDVAFVRNATEGVNAVLRSFPLVAGDEIVVTDHGYNACRNAAHFAAERAGARVVTSAVPFPIAAADEVIKALESSFTERTRLLLVDHVTSPTALVWPIEQIVKAAHRNGIRVLVDGAHAPGMVHVDLRRIDPDYYTANHHKWLCGPKASGFLYVRPSLQDEVRPTVISHAANRPRPGRSRFLAEFDWAGTYDPTALLAVPEAIEFLCRLGPDGLGSLTSANRELAIRGREILLERLSVRPPCPPEMLGSMATICLPVDRVGPADPAPFQQQLFDTYGIEVPIFFWPDREHLCLRVSAQAYNTEAQYERLAQAILAET